MRGDTKALVQAILAGGVIGLLISSFRRKPEPGVQADCSLVTPEGGRVAGVRYLESVTGGGDPSQPLPMLVVFHSRGASAAGAAKFGGIQTPVRVIRPEGTVRLSSNAPSWFTLPSKTSDTETYHREMSERSAELGRFLAELVQCRPTVGRPVVTGTSEGAHVAYLLASQNAGQVQGAVALLGYLPQPFWNSGMAPTVGMHGTNDNTVPYARTKTYWDAMQGRGANLATQSFPTGHSVSSGMTSAWYSAVRQMLGVPA